MRVVVPYAELRPETQLALATDGIDAEYAYVGGSPTAYYELLTRLWAEGRGFIIVEHDIVPWPGAIAQLEACPCEWGGFAYQISTAIGVPGMLGLTKFSDSLVAGRPGVAATVATLPEHGTPARYWGRLDTRLKQVLEDFERMTFHTHWPVVGHLNPAQQFHGAFHYPCGHEVPRAVWEAGPWPYATPCAVCSTGT